MEQFMHKVMVYSCEHIYVMHAAHFAGGFGLALLIQHYVKKNSFLPPIVGWLLIAFAVAAHIMAFMS